MLGWVFLFAFVLNCSTAFIDKHLKRIKKYSREKYISHSFRNSTFDRETIRPIFEISFYTWCPWDQYGEMLIRAKKVICLGGLEPICGILIYLSSL